MSQSLFNLARKSAFLGMKSSHGSILLWKLIYAMLNATKHPKLFTRTPSDYLFWDTRLVGLVPTPPEPDVLYEYCLEFQEVVTHIEAETRPYPALLALIPEYALVIPYFLTRMAKPSTIVETGVANGTSTSAFIDALEKNGNGRLYSIDPCYCEFIPKGKSTGWLVPEKLKYRWSLVVGTSSEKLIDLLSEVGEVDLFMHDSLHTYDNMIFELDAAWPFIKKGGIIIVDDINVNRAFRDFTEAKKPTRVSSLFNRIGMMIK